MLSFCPVQGENIESAKVTQKLGHTREGSLNMDSYFLFMANFYLFVFVRMEKHYTKCAGKVMDQKRTPGNPVIIF